METITRFAPSPTGFLHLGGIRTALFNFLHAKSNGGKFLIRIEDTDQTRNIKESIDSILDGLDWLGLKHDGVIIYQSNQIQEHKKIINQLIDNNFAYKCFHTEDEIQKLKKNNKKFKSKWRDKIDHPKDTEFCVRIKSPIDGQTIINDKIQGKVKVENKELDDFVIMRSDNSPTFLLSSAIDDFMMSVTDIIRGDDHLTNSFRQMVIFNYLDYHPTFSHMPLIHSENNEKLSKRHNALSIQDYKNAGFLPETMINYLLRLGWSYGDKEIISLNDAIKNFKIEKIGKSPSKLDEKKLLFLNNFYIKSKSDDLILNEIKNKEAFSKIKNLEEDFVKIKSLINIFKERSNTLNELIDNLNSIYEEVFSYSENEKKILNNSVYLKNKLIDKFSLIESWDDYILENVIKEIINNMGLKFKDLGQPLRLILFGTINGPSVSKVMEIIGKKTTLRKIKINCN
ncbi:MAG: glutamate--tRNA ligase [Rickettsiales bacterium]|nr:glutamate--tRNA ligase [Rickettsiales bacterium]